MKHQRQQKLEYLLEQLSDSDIDPAFELLLENGPAPKQRRFFLFIEATSHTNTARMMLITIICTLIVTFAGLFMGQYEPRLYFMLPTYMGIVILILLARQQSIKPLVA